LQYTQFFAAVHSPVAVIHVPSLSTIKPVSHFSQASLSAELTKQLESGEEIDEHLAVEVSV
jgi:hypothetical protein